jgi:predicted nucleotidyltransferase
LRGVKAGKFPEWVHRQSFREKTDFSKTYGVARTMDTPSITEKAKLIRGIARKHGVTRLRMFGSRASGTAKTGSDLDLLVELRPDRDLLDLIEFKLDLEDLLGHKVDVLTEGGLSPYLRGRILREAKPL